MNSRYDEILAKINNSKSPVFLTGAGVSTHSGINDYRGNNGIYKTDNAKYFNREYYNEHKAETTDFILNKLKIKESKPNAIHKWIANYKNAYVITQNIDGLHQDAGSETINYHGYVDKKTEELHVVFFGDEINPETSLKAIEVINKSDLIIVIGTSFQVEPFCSLPFYSDIFTEKIYINLMDTNSNMFDIKLIEDAINIAEYSINKSEEE